MKRAWLYVISILPLLLFTACKGEEEDIYGIFYADIVTCHTGSEGLHFSYQTTDSTPADTLYPTSPVTETIKEGERVLLQFRPVEQLAEHRKRIEVQALSAIHFDTLRVVGHNNMDKLPDDTLYLQSVWKTGDFLNLRYRIDYHSRPHSIMLITDEETLSGDTLKLQLRHSRNDDPEGHWSNMYSSFNISACRKHPYTTIQLYVNQVNFNHKFYYFKLN